MPVVQYAVTNNTQKIQFWLNVRKREWMKAEEHKKKDKGKSVPLQAWTGPEGSRNLRLPDLVTTAQDGGKFVSLTHRSPLPPGNTPGTHFC